MSSLSKHQIWRPLKKLLLKFVRSGQGPEDSCKTFPFFFLFCSRMQSLWFIRDRRGKQKSTLFILNFSEEVPMDNWSLTIAQAVPPISDALPTSPAHLGSTHLFFTPNLVKAFLSSLGRRCVLRPVPSCGREPSLPHICDRLQSPCCPEVLSDPALRLLFRPQF